MSPFEQVKTNQEKYICRHTCPADDFKNTNMDPCKRIMREFDTRFKHFPFGDCFITSHNLFS